MNHLNPGIKAVNASVANNYISPTNGLINHEGVAKVTIVSSARLHMGFFDLHGGMGRKYGSIGLSLAEPSIHLTAESSPEFLVTGVEDVPEEMLEKVAQIAKPLIQNLNLPAGVSFYMQQCIGAHAGLGSGTQLALAVGTALNKLYALNLSTANIAALTGRGGRSGIGIAAFDYGGLLIDGGRKIETSVPPLLARYDFPEAWRILLIFDQGVRGVHGQDEREAFKQLPEFSENLSAHLCRCVLMQAMPALVEQDLQAFGQSIQELQKHTGDYFAPAQGGRYASRQVSAVLDSLAESGVACFGQSSWGPTGFAVFETQAQAEAHLVKLKEKFVDVALSWLICKACNQGASVSVSSF